VTLSDPGQYAASPQVVTDGSTITAVWIRSDGSRYRVQSASSTDGGATWSAPVTLSDPGQSAGSAQVVTDGSSITAVWSRSDGSKQRVQSASSIDGGATWSAPVTLSDPGQDAGSAQVVTDGSTITAVWARSDGSSNLIQSASSIDRGATWSAPVTLSDPGQNAGSPQVVTDGSTLTAVWARYNGSYLRVESASSIDRGATWSAPVTLSDPGQNAYYPQIVTDGSTITAVWTRYDGSKNRIQSASSTDGGATWSAPVTLSDPGQDADTPQVVTDGSTITAVWARSDGSNQRIQTSSYTTAGSPTLALAATGASQTLTLGALGAAGLLLAGGLVLTRVTRREGSSTAA
jgi:hypothetical protein